MKFFSWKTRISLACVVNDMSADGMVMQQHCGAATDKFSLNFRIKHQGPDSI